MVTGTRPTDMGRHEGRRRISRVFRGRWYQMSRPPYHVIGILSVWLATACSSSESNDNAGVGGNGSGAMAGAPGNTNPGGGNGGIAGAAGDAIVLCQDGCVATLAAGCSNGPSDQVTCERDCAALLGGTCSTQYRALQTCAVGKAVTCGSTGIPVIAPCAAEQTAFIACLN
jgi:hypothetical protein